MNILKIGCFGDDFTGAGDAASFIKKAGLRTVLLTDIPSDDFVLPEDIEAAVIALKIRTVPAQEAVETALKACDWLKSRGAKHLYYKYCSTFDSTDEGNIGPITDAILEKYNLPGTILCPALPVNGRTVENGKLYVNGVPLDETHMRHHPLTPMCSASIPVLMQKQGKYPCLLVRQKELSGVEAEVQALVEACAKINQHYYLVPDYVNDDDARRIARHFGAWPFLTGGSGILTALGQQYLQEAVAPGDVSRVLLSPEEKTVTKPALKPGANQKASKALLLAGSCSAMTLRQVQTYQKQGPALQVSPAELFDENMTAAGSREICIQAKAQQLWQQVISAGYEQVLIYTSSAPEDVRAMQAKFGKEEVSRRLEGMMASLALLAVKSGWKKLVVAGGETSGSVTEALHCEAYRIGVEIAPGVPVLEPLNAERLQLVLKSGNFGQEDFFTRALQIMETNI